VGWHRRETSLAVIDAGERWKLESGICRHRGMESSLSANSVARKRGHRPDLATMPLWASEASTAAPPIAYSQSARIPAGGRPPLLGPARPSPPPAWPFRASSKSSRRPSIPASPILKAPLPQTGHRPTKPACSGSVSRASEDGASNTPPVSRVERPAHERPLRLHGRALARHPPAAAPEHPLA
jgi:hypothetical protein